jgi:lipopolysaccharide export LptBFGC system permease protein LptF
MDCDPSGRSENERESHARLLPDPTGSYGFNAMSRTLFWYVFKDLIRIFVMASLCLAGIMSFGGLLKPLTDQGLDASQVGKILLFFIPAMTTYSLPIAAIFATTIVYGRLSADNELTGCRAAGISYLSIATPAVVLGLVVSLCSIMLLCFVVPAFTYKVEQVIYSNIAQLVAGQIERKHQIRFKDAGTTIFAMGAQVVPQNDKSRQLVILERPMIVTYEPQDRGHPDLHVPKEFWMARQADVYITQRRATDQIMLEATLVDGTRFPRHFVGATQGSIAATAFGPYRADSPMQEDTKFMTISELKLRLAHPEQSKVIEKLREQFLRADQEHLYLAQLQESLMRRGGALRLEQAAHPEGMMTIERDGPIQSQFDGNDLVLSSPEGYRSLRLVRRDEHGVNFNVAVRNVRLRARADDEAGQVDLSIRGSDVVEMSGVPTPRPDFERRAAVAMPQSVRALDDRPIDYYSHSPSVSPKSRDEFRRDLIRLRNGIRAELNNRAAFGVSCLILVIVGCALGMMFRSGNFLTAFALSVIPAILTITLIVTGQQIAQNTHMASALPVGLTLIWSGNVVVAILAAVLMGRLQRT